MPNSDLLVRGRLLHKWELFVSDDISVKFDACNKLGH